MTTHDRPIMESVREAIAHSRRVVANSESVLVSTARLVGSTEQSNRAMRDDLSAWRAGK